MTARRILLVVLLILVLVPVSVVALYFVRGSGGGAPMTAPPVSTPVLSRWAEDMGDAASPRDPHTSMRTLEAFIVDRVATHVTNIGDPSRVQINSDGPAAPIANAIRERLGTNLGTLGAAGTPNADEPSTNPTRIGQPDVAIQHHVPVASIASDPAPADADLRAADPTGLHDYKQGRLAFKAANWALARKHFVAAREQAYRPKLFEDSPEIYLRRIDARAEMSQNFDSAGRADGSAPAAADAAVNPVEAEKTQVEAEASVPAMSTTAPNDEQTIVTLAWRGLKQTPVAWSRTPVRRGELIASVQGPRGNAVVTAELDEKPWLLIPPVMEGRADFAVASVGTPMSTEDEARHSAQQITVDTLIAHLDARVRSMHRGSLVSRDSLRRQAEWAVLGGGGVVDQCVVRVDRPYGAVWYAANLVDTSPARLDPLARVVARGAESQKRSIGASLIALPGMMLVLGVVYLALNALTRGYFRTHLRTMVVGVMAVAVLVVFLLVMG